MSTIGRQVNLSDLYTTQIVSAGHKPDGTAIKIVDGSEHSGQEPGVSNHSNSANIGRTRVYLASASHQPERVTLLTKENIFFNPNGDRTLTKVERSKTRISFDDVMPPAILARIADHINSLRDEHDIPGLALSISTPKGSVTICSGVMNRETKQPVDTDTQFMLASVTKTYTATMIMQMVQEGRLSLDDKLADLTADGKQKLLSKELLDCIPNAEKISVGQLLQHTSGLPDPDFANNYLLKPTEGEWNSRDVIKMLDGLKSVSEPGDKYAYNNAGYSILGEVLKHVDGKASIDDVFQERIARTIGLGNTKFGGIDSKNLASAYVERESLPPALAIKQGKHEHTVSSGCTRFEDTELHRRNHLLPEGGLVTPIADMQKFMQALFRSDSLLNQEHRDLMQGNGAIKPKAALYLNSVGDLEYYRHYALGLNVVLSPQQLEHDPKVTRIHDNGIPTEIRNNMGTSVGHSGVLYGYQTDMKYYPEHQFGVCMLSNAGLFQSTDTTGKLKANSLDFLVNAKLFSDPEIAAFLCSLT